MGRLGLDQNQSLVIVKEDAFLCWLSRAASREFAAIRHPSAYPTGKTLFLEKDDPAGFFLLYSGLVKLSVSSRGGKTLILKVAGPGEIIGLAASMAGIPYESSAETLQPCEASFIRRDDFARFAESHPQIYWVVIRQLASQYSSAYAQLRTIGLSHSAPQRVARLLLDWSATGRETKDGTLIMVPLTHEQIAECVGSSRETVTRTLSDFKNKRLIILRGATITIPNRAALEVIGGD
jgi:CRP/FNR family transcriptional regulator, cyclic AMP receptor protein